MPEKSVVAIAANRLRNIDRRGRLRPMTTSQIIDLGLQAYRRLAWPLAKASVFPTLVSYVGITQITTFVLPYLFTTRHPNNPQAQFMEGAVALAIGLLLSFPLIVVGFCYPVAYSSILCGAYVRGDTIDPNKARDMAVAKLGELAKMATPTIMLGLLPLVIGFGVMGSASYLESLFGPDDWRVAFSTVVVFISFITAVITLPMALGSITVAGPAIANEPINWKQGLVRSRFLRKSYPIHGSTFGTMISLFLTSAFIFVALDGAAALAVELFKLVPFISDLIAGANFGPVFNGMLESLATYVSALFLLPFYICAATVIYLERRVRLEALDIELLSEDIRNAKRLAKPVD